MINLTGLWLGKDKNGNSLMKGNLNEQVTIYVFKNTNKTPDSKQPDYFLKIAKNEKDKPPQERPNEEAPF